MVYYTHTVFLFVWNRTFFTWHENDVIIKNYFFLLFLCPLYCPHSAGMANVVSCFLGSYPVTGSFSRSEEHSILNCRLSCNFHSRTAVNSQSGVKTPAGGIFTGKFTCKTIGYFYILYIHSGCVVLLAIGVLSQAFDYIPKTSLAAIIIAAVLYMVDVKIVWTIFKIKSKI